MAQRRPETGTAFWMLTGAAAMAYLLSSLSWRIGDMLVGGDWNWSISWMAYGAPKWLLFAVIMLNGWRTGRAVVAWAALSVLMWPVPMLVSLGPESYFGFMADRGTWFLQSIGRIAVFGALYIYSIVWGLRRSRGAWWRFALTVWLVGLVSTFAGFGISAAIDEISWPGWDVLLAWEAGSAMGTVLGTAVLWRAFSACALIPGDGAEAGEPVEADAQDRGADVAAGEVHLRAVADPPTVKASVAGAPRTDCSEMNWHFADDPERHLRQVVLDIPSPCWHESRFGSLLLAAKYRMLLKSGWTADFFRTDSEPGPFLMVRADGLSGAMKSARLRIGFTFARRPTSGLFAVYVEPLPSPEGSPHAFIEVVNGLDVSEYRERVGAAFDSNGIDIVLADRSNMSVSIVGDDSTSDECVAPVAVAEACVRVPAGMSSLLQHEWRELLAYHDALPAGGVDHVAATREFWDLMPTDSSPLLGPAG